MIKESSLNVFLDCFLVVGGMAIGAIIMLIIFGAELLTIVSLILALLMIISSIVFALFARVLYVPTIKKTNQDCSPR